MERARAKGGKKFAFGIKLLNMHFLNSATIEDLEIYSNDALIQEKFLSAFHQLYFVETGARLF